MRIASLVLLLIACLGPHLLSRLVSGRSPWPRRFLAAAARIVGTRVRMLGEPIGPHSLLVCNHLSWIDILAVGDATGSRFVSKHQLGHGILHWLADQNETIYVDRGHRKGSRDQAATIASALESPRPIALFPEGTTGSGDRLLPFRTTLFEAAALARVPVEVRPVAIDYGAAAAEVGWHGEDGKANALRLLGRREPLDVTIRVLPALDRLLDRKQLAEQSRARIAAALDPSDSDDAGL